MSNQRRVEESPYEVGFFAGINQAVDELNLDATLCPWIQGGYPSERGNIRRIPGKVMASTGTLGGTVLTLTQLRFSRSVHVVLNRCGTWVHETDVATLQSRTTYAETLPPTDRFILE
jgi:hypothetical protein